MKNKYGLKFLTITVLLAILGFVFFYLTYTGVEKCEYEKEQGYLTYECNEILSSPHLYQLVTGFIGAFFGIFVSIMLYFNSVIKEGMKNIK